MKTDLNLKNISGIYQIVNKTNGKIYIGRTKCFYRRCHQYLYDFRCRRIKHINGHFLNAMLKYSIDNFSFEILEKCESNLPERELFWILFKKSNDRNFGYNLRLDVDGVMLTSKETSIKISTRLKREWSEGLRNSHAKK